MHQRLIRFIVYVSIVLVTDTYNIAVVCKITIPVNCIGWWVVAIVIVAAVTSQSQSSSVQSPTSLWQYFCFTTNYYALAPIHICASRISHKPIILNRPERLKENLNGNSCSITLILPIKSINVYITQSSVFRSWFSFIKCAYVCIAFDVDSLTY